MSEENKDSSLSDAAKRMSKAGSSKGGVARNKSLSSEEKSEIGRLGGLAKSAKQKSIKSKLSKHKKKKKGK